MHKETIKRELWRIIKLLLLMWLLNGVFTILGGGVLGFHDLSSGMSKEAIGRHLEHSDFMLWMDALDSLLVIAVFVYYKYVKISMGRLRRQSYNTMWTAAIVAALIAVCLRFIDGAFNILLNYDVLFAEDMKELEEAYAPGSESLIGFLAFNILTPIVEEIAFRGVLLRGMLKMRLRPWVAIVISAFVFALLHGTNMQLLTIFIPGIILGWLYWHTKSIVPGMIVHIMNNSICGSLGYFQFGGGGSEPTQRSVLITCLVIYAIFVPLLLYCINWYKKH